MARSHFWSKKRYGLFLKVFEDYIILKNLFSSNLLMAGVLSAMGICKFFSVNALLVLLAIYTRFEAGGFTTAVYGNIKNTLDTYLFREYHEPI